MGKTILFNWALATNGGDLPIVRKVWSILLLGDRQELRQGRQNIHSGLDERWKEIVAVPRSGGCWTLAAALVYSPSAWR